MRDSELSEQALFLLYSAVHVHVHVHVCVYTIVY